MFKSDIIGEEWNPKKVRGGLIKGQCFVKWVSQKENKKKEVRMLAMNLLKRCIVNSQGVKV